MQFDDIYPTTHLAKRLIQDTRHSCAGHPESDLK